MIITTFGKIIHHRDGTVSIEGFSFDLEEGEGISESFTHKILAACANRPECHVYEGGD